jgi:surface antigen/regulator of replication initiation timing
MEKSDARQLATYLLAGSIFSLAVAIIYFTIEVRSVSQQIPAILSAVESTSKNIEPVLEQVGEIKDLIPPILNEWTETRKQVPLILDEVKATRELVPPVLDEVAKVREQIPPVLKEVEAIREDLPAILDTSNKALKEVAAVRATVPSILEEVKKTREFIPPTLDRVEYMIADARVAGREASEGAVTGVITGIFTAPFRLVGNIGKSLGLSSAEMQGLTNEDMEIMNDAARNLASKSVNEVTTWKNPETGTYGNIKLLNIFEQNGRECRTALFEVWKQGKTKIAKEVSFCKNEQGSWDPLNSTDKK